MQLGEESFLFFWIIKLNVGFSPLQLSTGVLLKVEAHLNIINSENILLQCS
jgi:hypothetical protein